MARTKVVKLTKPGSFKVFIGLKQYLRTISDTGTHHQLVVVPIEEYRTPTFRNVESQPLCGKIEKLIEEFERENCLSSSESEFR